LKKESFEGKEQGVADVLQIIKAPGIALTELENTGFIYRPSPGHIELSPLL
jgi:hypothetical protein